MCDKTDLDPIRSTAPVCGRLDPLEANHNQGSVACVSMVRDDQRTSTVTTVNGVLHKTHTADGLQVPHKQSKRRREHTTKTSQQRDEHDAFPLPPPAHAAFQSGTPSVAPGVLSPVSGASIPNPPHTLSRKNGLYSGAVDHDSRDCIVAGESSRHPRNQKHNRDPRSR